jgi:hypothetical protein
MESIMKRILIAAVASLSLLLGGCATTIRSDVTTFNQWPAQLPDKSYAFEAPPPQDNTLELQSYENLVRAQLARLGFHESQQAPAPSHIGEAGRVHRFERRVDDLRGHVDRGEAHRHLQRRRLLRLVEAEAGELGAHEVLVALQLQRVVLRRRR